MNLAQRLTSVGEQIDSLLKEAAAPLGADLVNFLQENPNIEAFKWHQYTPYFNDGDTCEFSVNEPYFKLVGADPEAGDYGDGFVELYELREAAPANIDALKELSRAIQGNDAVMQQAFGDHVVVTVDKDGVHVDEYEHD